MKWPTTQLKRVALLVPGGTPSVDEPRFWSPADEGTSWVTIADMTRSAPVESTARRLTPEGLVSKRLQVGAPGTVLFAMYASVGAVNVLGSPAAWNQAILGIEPRPGLSDTTFLAYWLQSLRPRLSELFRSNTQDNINAEQVGSLPFPSSPLQEQRAIANFLDAETARIDALITKKRELRRLLQVRAAALRTAAFNATHGWRLKQLLKAPLAYGVLVPRLTTDYSGAIMLRINALTEDGRIDLKRAARIEPTQSIEYRRTILAAGDLVLSVVGSMGRSAVVTTAAAGSNLNRPLARLQPRADLPTNLLWHWTQTEQFAMQARLATGGDTAQPTLNLGDLAEFKVGLPKEESAWQGILQTLNRGLKPIEMTDNRLQHQTELLREHRQALITAAVMGELDIRVAAA